MFYLAGNAEPTNSEEFIHALDGGVREVLIFPPNAKVVTFSGEYPAFDSLLVDLTDSRLDASHQLQKPTSQGPAKAGITAKTLQVSANPLWIDAGRLSLKLMAQGVVLSYATDASGRRMLVPVSSEQGSLTVEISRADLEALILTRATIAAAQQGAKITGLELKLTARGERSLAIDLRVHAKKMMMAGIVRISGNIDIDDALTARLSHMECAGDGVAGKIAAGFLSPKIKQVDGRSFPLADESLNGLRLRDLRITSVDPVRIVAAFGN